MPTHVETSPDLPHYFEFNRDINDASIMPKFESGIVQIFDDFPLISGIDLAFLSIIGPAEDSKITRKCSEIQMLAELGEGKLKDHILAHYTNNEKDARKLQQIILDTSEKYRNYFKKTFPGYQQEREKNTWRFTEARNYNMHFDSYYHPEKFYIRMFTNLDSKPRIWRTSYSFQDACALHQDAVRKSSPDRVCEDLNDLIFNTFDSNGIVVGGRDDFPYHEFHFEPGTAWLVYSQCISHQIVYGNRMLTNTTFVPASSMQNPDQSFDAILDRSGVGAERTPVPA